MAERPEHVDGHPYMLGSDYTADDGLGDDGRFAYAYAHRHRRILKRVERFDGEGWRTGETHDFTWGGMNIVLERIAFADGTARTVEYFWGDDLSGTEQGAGGVGGLLAVSIDGAFFIPCYDHNGNVVSYVSESGAIAAQYVYDPYGNVIEQYGTLSGRFAIRFSTKYTDVETGLISYLRRFYRPDHGRWLNRDPIEENGGENLYAFCLNSPLYLIDPLGLSFWDSLLDAAKIVVGFSTAAAGATFGAGASWTGVGGVMGGAMFIMGVDQMLEGINSIASRMQGGPASDNSPIKQTISSASRIVTGKEGSSLEYYLSEGYSLAQLASSCFSGIASARAVMHAVKVTYVPPHSEVVPYLDGITVRWRLELRGAYWKTSGVGEAVESSFGLVFEGITKGKHSDEGGDE